MLGYIVGCLVTCKGVGLHGRVLWLYGRVLGLHGGMLGYMVGC